jgi:general secretion pathway protein K
MLDWADSDETIASCLPQHDGSVSMGAEDNFYQTIGLPYLRKNAGYDSLEELRLVRGMGDDFWATFVDPDPSDPSKRNLTVWGQGKVNINTTNPQTMLALACSYADPGQPLCTDIGQMTTFLGMVSMIRQFGQGVPIFSSPKEFIKTLEGGSMLGPALTAMGVQPLTFSSKSELTKVIDTKSKVFSIYAEGVVPGRLGSETRVAIHAVVDFRQASELPAAVDQAALADFLKGGAGSTNTGAADSGLDPDDPAAVLAALAQDPAGLLVYYRID